MISQIVWWALSISLFQSGSDESASSLPTNRDFRTSSTSRIFRWLYRQLEREYDYLSSDEAVDETIAANEYTFTAAGRRFG